MKRRRRKESEHAVAVAVAAAGRTHKDREDLRGIKRGRPLLDTVQEVSALLRHALRLSQASGVPIEQFVEQEDDEG